MSVLWIYAIWYGVGLLTVVAALVRGYTPDPILIVLFATGPIGTVILVLKELEQR